MAVMGKTATVLLAFGAGTCSSYTHGAGIKEHEPPASQRHHANQPMPSIKQAQPISLFPPNAAVRVKVHIKVQGSLRELPAMTDDEEEIATGKLIRVKNIINDSILLVTIADNNLSYKI